MLESYPAITEELLEDQAAETAINWLKGVIGAVRNIRGERQIPPNTEDVKVLFSKGTIQERDLEEENIMYFSVSWQKFQGPNG